jgi:hypothetical protein
MVQFSTSSVCVAALVWLARSNGSEAFSARKTSLLPLPVVNAMTEEGRFVHEPLYSTTEAGRNNLRRAASSSMSKGTTIVQERDLSQESPARRACFIASYSFGLTSYATCTCSEDLDESGQYILDCEDTCTHCSDVDDTICARESTQLFFEAETGENNSKASILSYSGSKSETITLLETDCALDQYGQGNCTQCNASVDAVMCNSCSIQTCVFDESYSYSAHLIDCSNVGALGVYNFCGRRTIPTEDPLHALGNEGFLYCADLGTGACQVEKVIRLTESESLYCQCSDRYDDTIQLRCFDQCGLLCSEGGEECGRSTSVVAFAKSDGSVSYESNAFEYSDGQTRELQVLASQDNCTYSTSEGGCDCFIQTCEDGTVAPMVDCSGLNGGVLNLCHSAPVVDNTIFSYLSFDNCIDFSPDEDVCSDSDEALSLDGSTVTGSLLDAMFYDVESCANDSDGVGLWCK